MEPDQRRARVERLRRRLRSGSSLPGDAHGAWAEVRDSGDEAVLLLRWSDDPHLYGVPVDVATLGDAYRDEAATEDEWLSAAEIELMVSFDTGLRARARRRLVDDYIELRAEGGWPVDDRFSLQIGDPSARGLSSRLSSDGLDPATALELHAGGRLLAWVVAYENNATGSPFVGHAVVEAGEAGDAALVQVETSTGVPDTVRLDLAYLAAHAAAERGATSVSTALPDPALDLAGYRRAGDVRRLDTDFLHAEPDAVRQLLEAQRAAGGAWGRDRDVAGRHLPATRTGRLLHILRRGLSGRPAKDVVISTPAGH